MIQARAAAFAIALLSSAVYSADESPTAGGEAYARHCAYCHGSKGQGIEPWYPAMRDILRQRDPAQVIHAVLNGKFERAGQIKGHTIPVMPGWARLDDQVIADIVNFIIAEWGNIDWAVTIEDVAEYRGAGRPPSLADLESAKRIYFERCVGCHGSDREGASGSALLPWSMQDGGPDKARAMIHYGSSRGMPGFGVVEDLTADDMNALAEFLTRDIETPPPFGAREIRASLRRHKRSDDDGASPAPPIDDLFVSLRHDIGGIVLIDGPTKRIVGDVATDLAPHAIALSRKQQALFVLSRGGRVARVDIATLPPTVTSSVRVGFEARSLTTTHIGSKEVVVAAAYNPGHIVVLEADSLALLDVLVPAAPTTAERARLAQVVAHPRRPLILAAAKDLGAIYRIDISASADLEIETAPASRFLRNGTFDPTGRLYVVPSDDEQLVLYDTVDGAVIDTVPVRGLSGPSKGLFFDDPDHGLVWLAVGLASETIPFLTTTQDKGLSPWSVVRNIRAPGAGSLNIASHPKSRNLWFDAPLNPEPVTSGSAFAISKARPGDGYTAHEIIDRLDPALRGGRVLHPQFNRDGDEVWFTIWNRQDEPSAVVVLEEGTGKIKQLIEDVRLVTPIRTFALWSLDETR